MQATKTGCSIMLKPQENKISLCGREGNVKALRFLASGTSPARRLRVLRPKYPKPSSVTNVVGCNWFGANEIIGADNTVDYNRHGVAFLQCSVLFGSCALCTYPCKCSGAFTQHSVFKRKQKVTNCDRRNQRDGLEEKKIK